MHPALIALSLAFPVQDPAVQAADISARIRTLASDAFAGRGPSSPGEEKTLTYLVSELERVGVRPAAGDSFLQPVPLVAVQPTDTPAMQIAREGAPNDGAPKQDVVFGRDAMWWSKTPRGEVRLEDSEIVFVGHGIVAPEYDWNDYEGLDARGKTVVILVNDPGYTTRDDELFRGRAMTYYGRWTYKFEEAARQGAAAAMVVHEEGPAGYPWQVVVGSWGRPRFGLATGGDEPACTVESWIEAAFARRLCKDAGQDFDALKRAALERDFRPVPLGARASAQFVNRAQVSESHNVAGVIRGSVRPDEYVLYCAHWDHLGTSTNRAGDAIFNGAVDNASGTAALLELAESFAALDKAPTRSVVFLATTAEESGLLGSKFYAQNPLFPLECTAAAINIDVLNTYGRTRDVVVVGYGASQLEEVLARAAAKQERELAPEPTPEKGSFYRSDHFNFAKAGVPVLFLGRGVDSREHGREWGEAQLADYTKRRYHKPADEFDAEWDLSGAVEDVLLYFEVGQALAQSAEWPEWFEGNEFRALREKSRAARH
ncbi:MAG: M20/M25/M40 family metallo-hydrolase [bacterium]|nr:M20/M25/M40 family metallo-hydrolase [bacterium]